MREVVYEDKHGYLRRVLIRDEDSEEMAPYGVPLGPPDVEMFDWERIKRDINNYLVQNKIETRLDLQGKRALEAICSIVKREVDRVFREKAAEDRARRHNL